MHRHAFQTIVWNYCLMHTPLVELHRYPERIFRTGLLTLLGWPRDARVACLGKPETVAVAFHGHGPWVRATDRFDAACHVGGKQTRIRANLPYRINTRVP